MIIHKDLQQGTDEWLKVRLGKFTASKASAIGSNGKGLTTLIWEKIDEIISGEIKQGFKNADMERGNELEPRARIAYEFETMNAVEQVGFIELDKYTGCSPDGLVGKDGLVEIKCPTNRVFYEYMTSGKIDTGYMWQMQMQLLVSGREWVDYVVFNPNFKNSTIIKRVNRDESAIAKIEAGLMTGKAQLESILGYTR